MKFWLLWSTNRHIPHNCGLKVWYSVPDMSRNLFCSSPRHWFGFRDSLTLLTGDNYRRIRQKDRDCDRFPCSSAEVNNALIVTPCSAYTFMAWCLSTVSSCFASAPHCMATDISLRRPCAVMRNVLSFTVSSCWHLAQPPSWRTTHCPLSAIVYSVYSQLPSILETVPTSATWGRTTLWWPRVLQIRVLRKILGLKRGEVTG
jgi:hypothetical protein